jgi:toxin ParE1/3/4
MAHRVSTRAERDLKSIAYYIATESGSVDIAEGQIDAITERFELLASHPEIGRARDDLGAGRRTFPVENYVILYRVQGADVLIPRVAHSRRDLDTLFRHWKRHSGPASGNTALRPGA